MRLWISSHCLTWLRVHATGLVAQSAIFTQAWQIGNHLAAVDAWSRALSAAAGQELKVAQ